LKSVGRTGLAAIALPVGGFLGGPEAVQSRAGKRVRQPLLQPQEIHSKNGVLRATIVAAPGQVHLRDLSLDGYLYNGSYLPPLLRPRLGDTMRITFRNDLPDPSNLHFHGMAVSPQGNSDNVFVHVHPGHQRL
jgi:FtsP/CotA-like multicopper oxidase with cupredoxin domain